MVFEKNPIIAVIGLGYVGLPLALAFGAKYKILAFDINENRIQALQNGIDITGEMTGQDLLAANKISFYFEEQTLSEADIYIVTVPTPVDEHKQPDMRALQKASELVGRVISKNNIVIYESTVYPGATEEVCIPIVESVSKLVLNKDFFAGYSPERINPGDKTHRLKDIKKVTSGSTEQAATYIDGLYQSIIEAGTHKASSIKVAEAAKVIENTQRDLNIALINELAIIFDALQIDTEEVLLAAGSKWNFLPFRPGLVGGHCIGVDPYYLTYKAQELGCRPEVILAGRRINDNMGHFIVSRVIKLMLKKNIEVKGAKVLVLGLAFKENCSDVRNSKVVDIIRECQEYGAQVDVYDPCVLAEDAKAHYGLSLLNELPENTYDAIIVAVAHKQFLNMGANEIRATGKAQSVVYDVKYILPASEVDGRL
jgi:UDP-N-acetyl-D-galactosamine dehydrogenase